MYPPSHSDEVVQYFIPELTKIHRADMSHLGAPFSVSLFLQSAMRYKKMTGVAYHIQSHVMSFNFSLHFWGKSASLRSALVIYPEIILSEIIILYWKSGTMPFTISRMNDSNSNSY